MKKIPYGRQNIIRSDKIIINQALNETLITTGKFVKQFEADFSPNGMFWSKVRHAYVSWYAEKNPDLYEEQDGKVRFSKEMPTGVPFLIEQLKKSTNIPTPKYVANDGFKPAQKDLW